MSSLQCSPALQQKQNIHHVPPQNPEMFHWTSGPRHQQMAGSNWQMSNCTPVAHPNPFQHHQNPAMSEVAFYDSSMQLKMPRQSMEYSRMISPVNQGVLNSGGYYMASGVRGQQGMVQGGSMVPDNRGMPYNAQMQMNGYMGQPGMVNGRSMMPSGEMMVEKGGNCDLKMTKMSSYSQQRVSPYVNPQQYMQNKRAQYNGTQQQQQQQQVNYKGGSQPRTPLTPMWTSNTSPWPRQAPLSPNSYPPSVRQYPPNCPPQHLPSSHSPIRGHFLNGAPRSYEMLPFPGNPTPPTTPGAAGAPPFYPSPDAENRMMRYRDSEPRLCFPIRDGQIMEPFRLEHNLSVTNHIFILREHVYQSLMSRPDLELQLKCYHNEDRMMMTNWPTTLNITLNSVPLTIDRGDDVTPHQPLLLKSYCRVENNMLQIAVSACCCSHLFVVQLVHRPAVRSVLENLLNKRLLPAEHGVTKIKRAFVGNENATIKLSLVCPISKNKIALPARGHDCQHIQCFDLESYLKTNCDLSTWMCPICKKFAMLEVLEIDQYIWAILKYVSGTRFDEVVIDSKGNWKPTTYNDISDADNMALKRGMILETMLMPTMSTWLSQQSPYLGQTTASNCLTPASSTSSSSGAFRSKEQEHAAMQQGKYLGGNGAPHGSSTTDYLGCLSQLSNSILSDDSRSSYIKCENSSNSSNANNNNNNNGNNHQDHVSFPPTPMGSQMSNICTPLDGQSLHPRTPSDGNPHTSPEALLHPQTPSECLLPKTPLEVGANSCNNSVGNFNSNMASASNMLDQKKGKPTGKTSSGYSTSPSKVDANNQSHEEIVLKQEEDIDFSFDLNLESLTGQDVKDNSTFGTSSNALALPESFDDDLSLYLGPSVKSEPPSTNADDLLQFL